MSGTEVYKAMALAVVLFFFLFLDRKAYITLVCGICMGHTFPYNENRIGVLYTFEYQFSF